MEKTTRIADLPENISVQMPSYNSNINQHNNMNAGFESPNNYIPINVHPNPYGISAQNPIMPIPQQPNVHQMNNMTQMNPMEQISVQKPKQQFSEQQMMELQNMQQMRLPSRDIPSETANYLQDEQIQPNYIPKPKVTSDYIRDYEETTDKHIREHEQKKYRESRIDEFLTELQTPILICILFFIFQLPIINTIIFKKFSFLSLHNEDGNFNFYGLLFKSMMFGSLFYSVQKITDFISEF
jgi:hypothetical protein